MNANFSLILRDLFKSRSDEKLSMGRWEGPFLQTWRRWISRTERPNRDPLMFKNRSWTYLSEEWQLRKYRWIVLVIGSRQDGVFEDFKNVMIGLISVLTRSELVLRVRTRPRWKIQHARVWCELKDALASLSYIIRYFGALLVWENGGWSRGEKGRVWCGTLNGWGYWHS